MKSTITQPFNPDSRESEDFFLNDPDKLDNPFPDLQYFRENHPIFFYAPLNQWFIFKYDDVAELFSDSRLSANRMAGFVDAAPEEVREDLRKIAPYLEMWVLMKDGAEHTRLRDFLHLGFNAAIIHGLKGQIQKSTDELLKRAEAQGYLDGAGDYGFLLTAYVLSDFLGVRQEDRAQVIQWSLDFVDFFNIIPITVDTTQRLVHSANGLMDYTRQLIAQRRVKPQNDFLTTLVKAAKEGDFTDDEIVANAMLILLAGHLAVRNLIGNVIYLLLTYPEQRAKLQSEPELLANVIQETLRYEPPVTLIPRVVNQDFEFQGNQFQSGQIVQFSIASANREPDHFPSPDQFDITRKFTSPVMSFGHGPHTCLGAILAKEETTIAIQTLFQRMPNLRFDESKPIKWYRNAGNRGPEILPLVF